MNFEQYLIGKRIDSASFKRGDEERWDEWRTLFAQVSEASFTSQKLYLINSVRRKYPLAQPDPPPAETTPPKMPRPVFKPKIN